MSTYHFEKRSKCFGLTKGLTFGISSVTLDFIPSDSLAKAMRKKLSEIEYMVCREHDSLNKKVN